ncbi:MAG: polyphenol oxidase family protein, partial [Coriobacteriia bacterium]|nr:polyphenol oxidase family protein [Coriobacteriia bacterium]
MGAKTYTSSAERAVCLTRHNLKQTTLLSDAHTSSGVVFAFTERSGGVSNAPFDSLNLAYHVGDEQRLVDENRNRLLAAFGKEAWQAEAKLLAPTQIHSDKLVEITRKPDEAMYKELKQGADGIILSEPGCAAMLLFADCVPVFILANKACALVHSGWRGTLAHIVKKALDRLAAISKQDKGSFKVYFGPYIDQKNYEVSQEMLDSFIEEFGADVVDGNTLDLGKAIY